MYVAYDLTKRGYNVTTPGTYLRYDLLAEKDGEIYKVQVKTVRKRKRNGKSWIIVDIRNKHRSYGENEVDLYAAYEPTHEAVLYIWDVDMAKRSELWIEENEFYELVRSGRSLDGYEYAGDQEKNSEGSGEEAEKARNVG